MTFSVSKPETQLSLWFAVFSAADWSVYRAEGPGLAPPPHSFSAQGPAGRPPRNVQSLGSQKILERGRWGSEQFPELAKGEGSPEGGDSGYQ